MFLFCLASYSLWDYVQMTTAAQLVQRNTWTSMAWFVEKGENCFWAAGISLHTAVNFSQAWLMLPVFLIPGAFCGQRAWRLELSGPQTPRFLPFSQSPSPTNPPPDPLRLHYPCCCLNLHSQQASTAPPTTVLTSALDIMSQGTPRPAKNAN